MDVIAGIQGPTGGPHPRCARLTTEKADELMTTSWNMRAATVGLGQSAARRVGWDRRFYRRRLGSGRGAGADTRCDETLVLARRVFSEEDHYGNFISSGQTPGRYRGGTGSARGEARHSAHSGRWPHRSDDLRREGPGHQLSAHQGRAAARRRAPNVLVVLLDDVGFGASSAFGGPCQTPNFEKLAAGGLKYTRFHTTALCSPTRQALLTGRNHHSVGMGDITETATAAPGYSSVLPNTKAPLAITLKLNGYSTAQFGKCHEVPVWQTSPAGPFTAWPSGGGGFEYFYGFIGGENNQWDPALYEGTTPIEPPKTPAEGYHLTEDLADKAINWVRQQKALLPDKPFFMYFAPGATHAPHQVPPEWIEKYKGKFAHGWDQQREITFERQKELGVIPPDAVLTPRHDEIPAWDDMDPALKPALEREMEVYAAFMEHTDHHVGRLLDALEPGLDNTLVYLIDRRQRCLR